MKFSVVIPNYNDARFIGKAIESALAVEWPDLEVIVVDDGSTDHSRAVVESFGKKIVAIVQPNGTQRVACNTGFARSTGDAVIFLDSDDVLMPSVAGEVAAVWSEKVSKVQFQMMRIDGEGRPTGRVFPLYAPMPTPDLIRAWVTETSAYPTPPGSGSASRVIVSNRLNQSESCERCLGASDRGSSQTIGHAVDRASICATLT